MATVPTCPVGVSASPTSTCVTPAVRTERGMTGTADPRGSAYASLPNAVMTLLPTPTAQGCGRLEELHAPSPTGLDGEHRRHPDGRSDRPDWGPYTSAIRRWEAIIGRAAPRPTEPADRGGERLNPRFVEWMQGLSAGWVTDILPRNPALKALGNGVVPQQAALAVTALLSLTEVAA